MKGKIAFVVGAAVGYVLGTRAGRERYEQIKRGAENVWNTAPVQRGVGAVRGAVQSKADELRANVMRAGKDAFASFMQSGTEARTRPAATAVPTSPAAPAAASASVDDAGAAARRATAQGDEQGGTA